MQEDLVLGEDPVMTMNIFVLFPHVAERENPGASFFLCVRALVHLGNPSFKMSSKPCCLQRSHLLIPSHEVVGCQKLFKFPKKLLKILDMFDCSFVCLSSVLFFYICFTLVGVVSAHIPVLLALFESYSSEAQGIKAVISLF